MRIPVTWHPPGIIPDVDCHILRRLSSVTSPSNDSAPCRPSIPAHPQKVDGMPRNQWTTYSGFGGRLAPESVVAFDRITHLASDSGKPAPGSLFREDCVSANRVTPKQGEARGIRRIIEVVERRENKNTPGNGGVGSNRVPLREDVELHLVPDLPNNALEVRIWFQHKMVHSLTMPLGDHLSIF